jgi:hypothetical protein
VYREDATGIVIQLCIHSRNCALLTSGPCQEYEGALNFATDAWTSPNHKAYVAITVHFEHEGVPISMLLDLVEVARSHSGVNLAEAFADVLGEFGIEDKVSFIIVALILVETYLVISDPQRHLR